MKPISVDVVIIGLNEELLLEECIRSVKNFSDTGNIIYVDSGSSDSSVSIALKNADTVICATNKPAFASLSRNIGLDAVESDYVLFLDGDMKLVGSPSDFVKGLHGKYVGIYGTRNDFHIDANKNIISITSNVYDTVTEQRALHVGGGAIYHTSSLRSVNGFSDELKCFEEPRLLIELASKNMQVLESPKPFIEHYIKSTNKHGTFSKNLKRCYEFGYLFGNCLLDRKTYQIGKIFPIVFLFYLTLIAGSLALLVGIIPALVIFILINAGILSCYPPKEIAVNILYSALLPFSLADYLVSRLYKQFKTRR